ncbi:MAG: bifunctional [glutamate--ammonia ligase]-adenylyl-L-tyrosine phosphorylase/[glutamate--ammonia-ligase] adenylyltransferase, partial [Nitrospinae bacterium]|nr:bifunctional [glutamate--ammonia ligase]-adenylyl-L-tyrosine phosphorylase/[glutamate--ammonia-ligase] adenylyltransferase [Nitrospinota bacterium]
REDEGIADIKLGRGGIIDIEFLTQYLLIKNGRAHSEIRVPNTYLALQALNKAGLLSDEDGSALRGGYRFLRLVENRLRIGNAQSINIFLKTKHAMDMLARRMNFVDDMDGSANAKLLAQFEQNTESVREVYEKIVAANE